MPYIFLNGDSYTSYGFKPQQDNLRLEDGKFQIQITLKEGRGWKKDFWIRMLVENHIPTFEVMNHEEDDNKAAKNKRKEEVLFTK
jgi:hypothetical protein